MNFKQLTEELHISDVHKSWYKDWELSYSTFPEGNIAFLQNGSIDEANNILQLPEEVLYAFHQTYKLITEHQGLSRLAWHAHRLISHPAEDITEIVSNWPSLKAIMGELDGMFPAVIFVSQLPDVMKFYRMRGIPIKIAKDTFSDMGTYMRNYYAEHGVWGLSRLSWMIKHFTCKLYRLGRLQFVPNIFKGTIKVFINNKNRKVIVLSEGGVRFRSDGMIDGTNDIYDRDCSWLSLLEMKDGIIIGNPIGQDGHAIKETICLPKSEWELVLSMGDPILDIHIPRGEKLLHEQCIHSYRMAMKFFSRYFPERPYVAFSCGSWLLDSQLENLLEPSSNILKFQRDFHIYPIRSGETAALEFIFGSSRIDFSKAPRDTALRRAVLDYISSGEHMCAGGGFILKDEIMLLEPKITNNPN